MDLATHSRMELWYCVLVIFMRSDLYRRWKTHGRKRLLAAKNICPPPVDVFTYLNRAQAVMKEYRGTVKRVEQQGKWSECYLFSGQQGVTQWKRDATKWSDKFHE